MDTWEKGVGGKDQKEHLTPKSWDTLIEQSLLKQSLQKGKESKR